MSYAETVYAQMLQMQMSAAKEAWLTAEQEKQNREERKQREFDQFSGVMDWLLRAQQERHKEEMDIAKVIGAGEGMAGKSSGIKYGGMAGQMQEAAKFHSVGEIEAARRLELAKQQEKREWLEEQLRMRGENRVQTETALTPVYVDREEATRGGKVETSRERAKATAPYRNIPSPPRPMSESQSLSSLRAGLDESFSPTESRIKSMIGSLRKGQKVPPHLDAALKKISELRLAATTKINKGEQVDWDAIGREVQQIENSLMASGTDKANAAREKARMLLGGQPLP